MRKTYLLDHFTLDMAKSFTYVITVNKINDRFMCFQITSDISLVNAIRRKRVTELINILCDTDFKPVIRRVRFKPGDVGIVVNTRTKLPGDLNMEKVYRLIESNKVSFYEVIM